MELVEQAVEIPVEMEQAADSLVAVLAVVADWKPVYSAGHPSVVALLISCPRNGPLHRLLHLLRLSSRVIFLFLF